MSFIRRRFALLAVTTIVCVAGACSEKEHTSLQPDEQRLVHEMLELITIRIETARDTTRAEGMRDELQSLYSKEELMELLDRLSGDSQRGHLVMAAIHESLQAYRPRLFPAGSNSSSPSASGRVRVDSSE